MAQASLLPSGGNVLVSTQANEAGGSAVPARFSFPSGFSSAGKSRLILQFAGPRSLESVSFDIAVVN